jgi:hypothetical protein
MYLGVDAIVSFGATAALGTAFAPETLGGSIAAVAAASTIMVAESSVMFSAGIILIAQGNAQIQGQESLPFDELKKSVERPVNSAGR